MLELATNWQIGKKLRRLFRSNGNNWKMKKVELPRQLAGQRTWLCSKKIILVKMVEETRIRMNWVREKKEQLPGWQPTLQGRHVSHTGTWAQRSGHREPEACVTFGHTVRGQRGADGDRTGQTETSRAMLLAVVTWRIWPGPQCENWYKC